MSPVANADYLRARCEHIRELVKKGLSRTSSGIAVSVSVAHSMSMS